MHECTTDTLFNGHIIIRQRRQGYRFSIDAVLLAHYVRPRTGETILDLGSGCGVIPLILVYRCADVRIYGVEIQPELHRLAVGNIRENGFENRVTIVRHDLREPVPETFPCPFDRVICNPLYRKARSGKVNPEPERALARHEISATIVDVLRATRRTLKIGGRFVTIYPAERSVDLFHAMRNAGIEPKRLQPVHSRASSDAKLILVEGICGSRPGVIMEAPLVIYGDDGEYTREVEGMFRP
ncbi:hypothetical protein D3OALGA1CA_3169 [Olavius algarvensis associated proteobacterium Delta 3]|nr:hypothetical protein D3OALGA1CA_3169 [Olavius algarvensis associated proteobacterium Delta 3]CAB5164902.1 hypothetical protein D3OALGB2SA_5679 [Olavius algarvensis associated proteobacterium Delta 3]